MTGASSDGAARRVLLIGRGLGAGGMERLLVAQVEFGDRRRFEYSVAYVNPDKDQLVQEFTDLGVAVHQLSRGRVPWPIQIRRLLAAQRYDVVHVHSPLVASVTRIAAKSVRPVPRLVYTEHNSWGPYSVPTRWANMLTYPLDDAQIAVSRAAWESVPARLRSKLEVIDHGIDVETIGRRRSERERVRQELGVADEELVVGVVANFRPEKNYEGMLRVAQQVVAQRPGVRFVSLGQGPLLEPMRQRCIEMGLADHFVMLGHKPDATSYMAGFDIFMLGSRWEGLPVAFMEARALGLPVVVTAVGGLVDHVRTGVDGLLVPPGSDQALAAALMSVLEDAELRSAMGLASTACAVDFDARSTVRRIEALYDVGRR